MSYFRNMERVVSSQLFATPNNISLTSNHLPIYLCMNKQPSIQHLHSSKALLLTIYTLRNLQGTVDSSYKKTIENQLGFLYVALNQYRPFVRRYVEVGGKITAEAIGNIYAIAQDFGLSNEWLCSNIQKEIPQKINNMSINNLRDVAQGLNKTSPNSQYLGLITQRIKEYESKFSEVEYVVHLPNETTQYEYTQNTKSNNYLIRSILSKKLYPHYYIEKIGCKIFQMASNIINKRQILYPLHSQ